jgi:4-hydroxy-tetrahydrodipicolinate synthase
MGNNMFKGSMVALVTPMKDDMVDIESLRRLVEFHIERGTQAIIAAGTTGEAATLTDKEKQLVIKTVVEAVNERIPVIAGTAAISTKHTMELTHMATELGADAALIMTPAYIKPSQQGLLEHYQAIAHHVPLPIIMYNVPSRTAVDLLPETIERLADISNIVGIKEATASLERHQEIYNRCKDKLDIYSGDDVTGCDLMLNGAKGIISVSANVVPKLMAKLCDYALLNQEHAATEIQQRLMPLHQALFIEANPIPVKWALYKMGLINPEIRLPLTALNESHQRELEKVLDGLGCL